MVNFDAERDIDLSSTVRPIKVRNIVVAKYLPAKVENRLDPAHAGTRVNHRSQPTSGIVRFRLGNTDVLE